MADPLSRIRVTVSDITRLRLDAIVTAANSSLLGGGGVDGAVHSAAGPELMAASRQLAPCPPGEARITPGFNLLASHVIHAVGPIYRDGRSGEPLLLARAYQNSLALAAEHDLREIAFPCISTGVYGYPQADASRVAIDTVVQWLRSNDLPKNVTFCCFDPRDEQLYVDRLRDLRMDREE